MKFRKILMLMMFALIISGCNIKLYSPSNSNEEESNKQQTSNNPNPGENSFIKAWNYNGSVNYVSNPSNKLSTEEVYNIGVKSTVYIIASNLNTAYLGSGVFFSEDENYAYLFTNAHVISEANNIEIVYSNYERSKAEVVGYNTLEDVAVLAVNKNNNYTIATLRNRDNLSVAEQVLAIGTPISIDYNFSATSGILSKINSPLTSTIDETYNLLLLQIDATLNSGNSGGPLFDMYGNLIGLNTMKILRDDNNAEVDDLNFAIPIDRATFIAEKIFNNKHYTRGLLGISIYDVVDLSLSERELYDISLNHGLYIVEVSENGASKNILKKGDVITKIEGLEFSTKIQFQKELYDKTKGENVTLTVYRNNSYQEVIVTLN